MNDQAYGAVSGLFSMLALGVLLFWLIPAYRLDAFREKLFALRGELFEIALDAGIPFSHPAYTTLRATINGLIRFAHRLDLAALTLFGVSNAGDPGFGELVQRAEGRWNDAIGKLSDSEQQKLESIRSRMHTATYRHVLLSSLCSPVSWPLLIIGFLYIAIAIAVLVIKNLRDTGERGSIRTSARRSVSGIRAGLDGAALEAGEAA